MRKVLFFCVLTQAASLVGHAVNLVPNSSAGVDLQGVFYDYYRIRYSSATGETGAVASVFGDSLKISFGGANYGGVASGTGLQFDFATANFGMVIQSEFPSAVIDDLKITATGTYSLVSTAAPGSFAQVISQIPFNMQVVGVNGVPYSSADLVLGYSLKVLPSKTQADFNVSVPANGIPVTNGTWGMEWSIQGLGASLAQLFNIPTMKITALDLAITPNLTSLSQDGNSSIYLNYLDVTPIPEPSGASLLALGGAWLISRRRKS